MKTATKILLMSITLLVPFRLQAQGTFSELKQPSYSGSVGISSMALGNNGEALIAWNPNAFEVRGLVRNDFNSPFSLMGFDGSTGGSPVVLINDYGDMVIGWSGINSGYVRIRFKPRGGAWEATKTLDIGATNNTIRSSLLGLSMNNNGDILAAWKVLTNGEQHVRTIYRPAGSAWPANYETVSTVNTLASDFYDPMAAIDDAGNQALFWTKQYAKIGSGGDGAVYVLIQALRAAGNASWQTPMEKTARGPLSGNVPCDASVTGMISINGPQISSDSKTGLVGIAYSYYPKAYEYQTGGEFATKCLSTAATLQNSGFAASYGSVSAGVSGTQMIHQGNDYYQGNFVGDIAVANNSSSATFLTVPPTDTLDGIPSLHFGVGNPLPSAPNSLLTGYYLGARTSIGRDGTAVGVVFDAGAGPSDEPEDTRPPTAFVMKNGQMLHGPVSLLPSGDYANSASNCRGDALIGVLGAAPDNKFYYIDYDSGNPNCVDGSEDPTPVPTASPTPTKTPDPSVPTKTPTPAPTADILAKAKANSANMYVALTNFYNSMRGFRHPLTVGDRKLKNIKNAWKKLQDQFPHSVVPELIINAPWNQDTFAKYYVAMKKAYRPVMNAPWHMTRKEERKYLQNLGVVRSSPDFMRNILGYR